MSKLIVVGSRFLRVEERLSSRRHHSIPPPITRTLRSVPLSITRLYLSERIVLLTSVSALVIGLTAVRLQYDVDQGSLALKAAWADDDDDREDRDDERDDDDKREDINRDEEASLIDRGWE